MGVRGVQTASRQGMLPQEELISVGVLGGTFDPIHIGHTALGNYLLTADFGLDELWLLPAMQNPLKEAPLWDFDTRCRFVRAAIKGDTRFRCCPIEASLPAPHYTLYTMLALREQYPDYRFTLIMGADNWSCINRWYHWRELLKLQEVIVYPREGFSFSLPFPEGVRYAVDAPIIEVSSSEFRCALMEGKDLRYWLPRPELFDELIQAMQQ